MKKQYFYFVSAGFMGCWGGWACDEKQALKLAEKDLKKRLPEPKVWQGKPNPMS